jgi:hypothetical protein
MFKKVMLSLALIAMATVALAGTLTSDGLTVQGVEDYNTVGDRIGLVNDGSFEFGECDAGSAWTCIQTTTCFWILDPLPVWGYAAYDGLMCGWLGGFCGDANENSLCQDLFIDGGTLNWFWMGHVSDPGDMVYVSVDGVEVWQHILELADHTYGIWQNTEGTLGGANVADFCGATHNVCLGFHLLNLGSNMLVDYVTLDGSCDTATADVNFSSVKALY